MLKLNLNDKVALVSCSNGQPRANAEKLNNLHNTLERIGLQPVWGSYSFETEHELNGDARDKAAELMHFFRDDDIRAVFDISGGDLANGVLPYLDYEAIAESGKLFYGYSDLTTVVNAIYAKTGRPAVLYQIRNLIKADAENQIDRFTKSIFDGKEDLFDISCRFEQKREMRGIVVGGNIRCLLKLAGTEYWPDMHGKILLLEAFGGDVTQMMTYLNQLKQLKVFEQVSGILLGTFTRMEELGRTPAMPELVKGYVTEEMPVACTGEIGHGADSKAILIGKEYDFSWGEIKC